MAEQCSEKVWESRAFRARQCFRKGTVECDEKWYCKQHDPVARKQKDDERYAAWEETNQRQSSAQKERDHKLATYDDLLAALEALTNSCTTGEVRNDRSPAGRAMPTQAALDGGRTAIAKAKATS